MQNHSYTSAYNKQNEYEMQLAFFNRIWKRRIQSAFVILFLSLMILLLYSKSSNRNDLGVAIFLTAYALYIFGSYFLYKKKLKDRLVMINAHFDKNEGGSTVFVNDLEFGIKGGFTDFTARWNRFTTFEYWKDYLVIYFTGPGSTSLIISKKEVGEEQFSAILNDVKEKINLLKNEVV